MTIQLDLSRKARSRQTRVSATRATSRSSLPRSFTRFNAAPLIKLKKAPRQVVQRILGELEVRDLIKHAKPGRDRLMLDVAYFGGLRVSELVGLAWAQVIRRDSGEAQLSIVGKGDKAREVFKSPLRSPPGCSPAAAMRRHRHPCSRQSADRDSRSPSARSTTSSKRRPNAPASTRQPRCIGCATPMRLMRSTTAHRLRSCRPPWAMPT